MGDKSPKATKKQANQKQAREDAVKQKKAKAEADREVVKAKK